MHPERTGREANGFGHWIPASAGMTGFPKSKCVTPNKYKTQELLPTRAVLIGMSMSFINKSSWLIVLLLATLAVVACGQEAATSEPAATVQATQPPPTVAQTEPALTPVATLIPPTATAAATATTASPTLAPTNTPVPPPTAVWPTEEPTPQPSPTAEVQPEPTPMEVPSTTPLSAPTETPSQATSTPVPLPTSTPEPTATAEPTPEPAATPTPEPTATPIPEPEPSANLAPLFSLPSALDGTTISLESYRGDKNVVVVFYRGFW